MGAHGERVADPDGLRAAIERCLASAGVRDSCGRGSGQTHVGAGLLHFKAMHQEPAGSDMDAATIDQIRLNFSPQSLVALNGAIGLMMLGVALDMKLDDFKRSSFTQGPGHRPWGTVHPPAGLHISSDPRLAAQPFHSPRHDLIAACPGGNVSNILTYLAREIRPFP